MFKKRVSALLLCSFLLLNTVCTSTQTDRQAPAEKIAEEKQFPGQKQWFDFCEWIAGRLHLLDEDL